MGDNIQYLEHCSRIANPPPHFGAGYQRLKEMTPGPGGLENFSTALMALYGYADVAAIDTGLSPAGFMTANKHRLLDAYDVKLQSVTSRRRKLDGDWGRSTFLILGLTGRIDVDHCGRQTTLSADDLLFIDPQADCILASPGSSSALVLNLPREHFASGEFRYGFGSLIAGQQGLGRLLSRFIRFAVDEDSDLSEGQEAIITRTISKLLEDRFASSNKSVGSVAERQLIERISAWAVTHIASSMLNTDSIAKEFGISRRGVYRLFSTIGTTPQQWIWQLRLSRAREFLLDDCYSKRTITQIAYSTGFNDSAHFSRAFKKQFGTSPRLIRSTVR